MERRQILKYVAAITGTSICAPLTGALLAGCSKQPEVAMTKTAAGPSGQFFSATDLQSLTQLMDTILPQTDSPSASQVNVHMIMDNMFAKVFKQDYQTGFMQRFAALNQSLAKQGFASADSDKQLQILTALEQDETSSETKRAYLDIKQQTIAYYLSTEQIAETYLNYLPIPGGYTPRISVTEVGGKAWAE